VKKFLFLIVFTGCWIATPLNLFSQDSIQSKWSFGITAGPQFTQISSPGLPAIPENGVGYLAGIFGEYEVIDNIKVRIGTNFDKRSFNAAYQSAYLVFNDSTVSRDSYTGYDLKYSVDYFTIPLSIIYTKGEGPFKLFIQGTFYYSFYLTAHKNGFTDTYIAENDFKYIDQEEYPNIKQGHNREDFSGKTDIFLANEKFNSSDIGLSFFIGGIYEISEKVGLYLSPGFTASFGRVLENPIYESRWIRVFKIETGVVIHLN
jgi:hypothetical protein